MLGATRITVPRLSLRCLSTSATETSATLCDVVQGPSLLRTPTMRPSPSLFWLPGLRSLPFWTSPDPKSGVNRVAYNDPKVKYVVEHLEANVDAIRDEYLRVAPTLPSDYEGTDHGGGSVMADGSKANDAEDKPNTLHTGLWEWHSYMNKGSVQGRFCHEFPTTSGVLQEIRSLDDPLLFEGTPFGFCFFSSLAPGASIAPHTSPMNLRLRIHLPLQVPAKKDGGDIECGIRVGMGSRRWADGTALVLDDAYEHQVWNDSDETRVLLLVDIWHPDVSADEKSAIVEMFQEAKNKGMWSK